MHWYRKRPHEAYFQPLPSVSSQHHLRFAWCCKITGYINGYSGRSLCVPCYEHLPEKYFIEPLYTHFLSDGHVSPWTKCAICEQDLVTRYPLNTCHLCTRIHLNTLTNFENNDQNINEMRDPILIHVEGRRFIPPH